ncbi:MAG: HAMP domain-containing protein [Desulfobacterales bacterium]|nr:HAMP domain-containing protein [Desulfobacterales bacterium]
MTVTVICEECGKTYHIPASKLEKMQGSAIQTPCKQCGHILTIEKPAAVETSVDSILSVAKPVSDAVGYQATQEIDPPSLDQFEDFEPAVTEPTKSAATPAKTKKIAAPNVKTKGLGLRSKMILLFLVVPLILMAISGFISLRQMNILSTSIAEDSSDIVIQLGEESVTNTAHAVARECQLYLANQPNLNAENFATDSMFNKIATQKVGKTGYTVLYSGSPFTLWTHPNAKLIGADVVAGMKQALGTDFSQWYNIVGDADKGKNVQRQGYYLWKDADGIKREKFMVISPIRGTRYGIAATTYIHEFTQPLKKLESRTNQAASEARNINFAIMIVTLIVVGLIVSLYGHRLTNNIKHLTDVADRISVGELDAEIQIRSTDEIGSLADAISRMQDSLRLSIMRLRRKR